jgi:hypothetical protein
MFGETPDVCLRASPFSRVQGYLSRLFNSLFSLGQDSSAQVDGEASFGGAIARLTAWGAVA